MPFFIFTNTFKVMAPKKYYFFTGEAVLLTSFSGIVAADLARILPLIFKVIGEVLALEYT